MVAGALRFGFMHIQFPSVKLREDNRLHRSLKNPGLDPRMGDAACGPHGARFRCHARLSVGISGLSRLACRLWHRPLHNLLFITPAQSDPLQSYPTTIPGSSARVELGLYLAQARDAGRKFSCSQHILRAYEIGSLLHLGETEPLSRIPDCLRTDLSPELVGKPFRPRVEKSIRFAR
jgi:hypothetical protein